MYTPNVKPLGKWAKYVSELGGSGPSPCVVRTLVTPVSVDWRTFNNSALSSTRRKRTNIDVCSEEDKLAF